MMMSMRSVAGVLVLFVASACGPRLRHEAEAPSTPGADTPVANMAVSYDPAKLDAAHKYTQDGQFTVTGLFYKDGQPKDAIVKVALKPADGGQFSRAYELDLADLAGSSAKVEMWDDGFLTVVIPSGEAPKPGFQTSNTNIKAASLEQAGQAPSTCYFGKQVLDGQIRFALCELQTESPRLAFVDAVAEAPAPGPEAAPASEAAPAGEPAPAKPAAN
jgi:hypothetical protein